MVAADAVNQALEYTVQDLPSVEDGGVLPFLRMYSSARSPLLHPIGTIRREEDLRRYWFDDYNTTFKQAIGDLSSRVESTPWEISSDRGDADTWQALLLNAQFGDWGAFVSKLVVEYSRQDKGAFIELIAPGRPDGPVTGQVVGLAVLDSFRCYPTGDPLYPVIYYSAKGTMHKLHFSRVVQFVDMPDSDDALIGTGLCALSRAIAPVQREILIGKYLGVKLDDKPAPGVTIFSGVEESKLEAAVERMIQGRQQDIPGEWGRNIRLYSLNPDAPPKVEDVQFSAPPEGFDVEKYMMLNARQIAGCIGIAFQDVWGELTVSALGSGGQAKINAQSARNKAFGQILKRLARVINQALPPYAEFRWKYEDPQQDMERAQVAQAQASIISILAGQSILSQQELRQYASDNIDGMRPVLTDPEGNIRRLADEDIKPAGEDETPQVVTDTETPDTQKALPETASTFRAAFDAFVQSAGGGLYLGEEQARAIFRDMLYDAGLEAYQDGVRDGGGDPDEADAILKADRRRRVAEWLAMQQPYIVKFVSDAMSREIGAVEAARRGAMWVNKSLRAIYYVGLNEAATGNLFQWQLGNTIDHCETCSTLNGQVHSLATWMKSGFTPGCTCLECGGYQCDCRFVPTRAVPRGRIPGQGVAHTIVDRVSDFLRRMSQEPAPAPSSVSPAAIVPPILAGLLLTGDDEGPVYAVVPKGERYCVYQLDEDGEPTGDSLGCYITEVAAQQRIEELRRTATRAAHQHHHEAPAAADVWSGFLRRMAGEG